MTFLEKINPFKITKQIFKQLNLTPSDNAVRETLEELMEEGDHQVDSDSHERTLLRNVLDLRDITA